MEGGKTEDRFLRYLFGSGGIIHMSFQCLQMCVCMCGVCVCVSGGVSDCRHVCVSHLHSEG